jgi:hypothetical protein
LDENVFFHSLCRGWMFHELHSFSHIQVIPKYVVMIATAAWPRNDCGGVRV